MKETQFNIDKTMASLDKIRNPEVSPLMADRIWLLNKQRSIESEEVELFGPIAWIGGIAAVVVINLAFMNWMGQTPSIDNEASSTLSTVYFDTEISY